MFLLTEMEHSMEMIVLSIMVLPLLLNIFLQADWYICLLFAFYAVFPDTFAIELSSSLPLVTTARILILINLFMAIYRGKLKKITVLPMCYRWYFIATIFILLLNIRQGKGQIAGIINIIVDQVILLILVIGAVDSEHKFYRYIDYMVYGFTFSAVVGIIQTALKIDLSKPVHLITNRQEMGLEYRMGLMRACGLSTSAIRFACECTIMIFITMFLYEKKHGNKYLIFMVIFTITLLCTMSRSSWVALAIVFIARVILRYRTIVKYYVRFLPFIAATGVVVVLLFPGTAKIVIEPLKTVINSLGANVKVSSDFGINSDAMVQSRTFQWSAVHYMWIHGGFLLGYGYNAYPRGMIRFYYPGYKAWDTARALDVGFVSLICERGLLGEIFYMMLLVGLFLICYKRKKDSFFDFMCFILIMYFLQNVMTSCLDNRVFMLLAGLMCSMIHLEKRKVICIKEGALLNGKQYRYFNCCSKL